MPPEARPGNGWAQARYVWLAVLVGTFAGILGSIFHLTIDALLHWPVLLAEVVGGPMLVVAAALVTMLATVASVYMVRRIAPEAGGSGVQEIEGAMEGLRPVRWARVLPVKFFAGAAAIGSGLVLGREGPTIHIGASIAAMFARIGGTVDLERRGLLAAGAAAGLACAFNAPVAAVLFIIEETHRQFPYTFRTYMGVIVAALLATAMTEMIGGTAPDLALISPEVPIGFLPLFAVLGCLLGAVGVLLNKSILTAVAFAAAAQQRAPYAYPAAVGLVVGGLFILMPHAVTGGETMIIELVRNQPGVMALLMLAILRFCTMVGSYSSGVPGGIFAPILALAVCIGLAFGTVADMMFPGMGAIPVAFAIAAMGGLFTASVRAPIVGVALTLELTGSYSLAMPLMATCVCANLSAQWMGGRPIYEQLLDRTLALAGVQPATRPKAHDTGLA
ncbi:H(+)/Cl(-) exchange transporter ClcA [Aureimonas fodinaquatilis]|uniref:H(+)/Cl(-) exchange transporter ClcA n=1 Tax=Aureimonas fodinaquatilis TaxID=2565783 RepID=A0A5B0DU62_9HYPH|nr:H(+)/Cl(-) exchange transporter ClcA [Aureimonas fodinaquatilis]